RNEQRRNSRNELPPPHSITSSSRTSSEASPHLGPQVYAFHYYGQRVEASPLAADEAVDALCEVRRSDGEWSMSVYGPSRPPPTSVSMSAIRGNCDMVGSGPNRRS